MEFLIVPVGYGVIPARLNIKDSFIIAFIYMTVQVNRVVKTLRGIYGVCQSQI